MFDINVKLGHWPYRPVKGLSALLTAMDARGIEMAAVSSLSAVHFLNPRDGNEELARTIASYRDRLLFFAVLRPDFAGCMPDLEQCINEYAAKGIVLHPNYHGFSLSAPELAPLLHEAARLRMPVCVQAGLEDVRRQFRPYKVDDVPASEIGELARTFPETTVIALGLKFGQPEAMGEPLPPNLYFDTSNYESMGELECAVPRFGADRILFGSNFPLFDALANVDKLERSQISETDKSLIASRNARQLFQTEGMREH